METDHDSTRDSVGSLSRLRFYDRRPWTVSIPGECILQAKERRTLDLINVVRAMYVTLSDPPFRHLIAMSFNHINIFSTRDSSFVVKYE